MHTAGENQGTVPSDISSTPGDTPSPLNVSPPGGTMQEQVWSRLGKAGVPSAVVVVVLVFSNRAGRGRRNDGANPPSTVQKAHQTAKHKYDYLDAGKHLHGIWPISHQKQRIFLAGMNYEQDSKTINSPVRLLRTRSRAFFPTHPDSFPRLSKEPHRDTSSITNDRSSHAQGEILAEDS